MVPWGWHYTASDGETLVQELWSTPSLPLLPDPLWRREVVPVRVPTMAQIELFNHLLVIWNHTGLCHQGLVLNNSQGLICHNTQQNQTKPNETNMTPPPKKKNAKKNTKTNKQPPQIFWTSDCLLLKYSVYRLHLYCYAHNVLADMFFGLLQVFHIEIRSRQRISNFIWTIGVDCSNSVNHDWIQVLSYCKLLLPVVGIETATSRWRKYRPKR